MLANPTLLGISVSKNLKPTVAWLCSVPRLGVADIDTTLLRCSLTRMKLVWQQQGEADMTAPQKRSILQRGKPLLHVHAEESQSGAAPGGRQTEFPQDYVTQI